MPSYGVQGFVGLRLREAREEKRIPMITLAEMAGVSRQKIGEYESGKQAPRQDVMRRLVEKLDKPWDFFFKPVPVEGPQKFFWRSLASATKTERDSARVRFGWLAEIVDYLQPYVEFPKVDIPNYTTATSPSEIENDRVHEYAARLRQDWGLGTGPIGNLVWLLEGHGCIVARDYLEANKLDAVSEWSESRERPFVLLSRDKGSCVRSRFDAAHELGHLVLHRHVDRERCSRLTPDYALQEEQANLFASHFLLPPESFAKEVVGADQNRLVSLKTRWRVSIGAMMMQMHHLGLLDKFTAARWWANYSHRGWRRSEPFDDSWASEEPLLLRKALEMLVKAGGAETKQHIKKTLSLASRDIEKLANVHFGFLDEAETPTNVVKLKPKAVEFANDDDIPF